MSELREMKPNLVDHHWLRSTPQYCGNTTAVKSDCINDNQGFEGMSQNTPLQHRGHDHVLVTI